MFLHIFKRLNSCVDRLISRQAAAAAGSRQGEESQFEEIRTRTQSQVQLGLINALCRATRKLTLHALTLDKRPSSEQPQCGGQVSLIALRIDLNRCTLHILCIFMARMKPKSNSKLQSLERQLSRAQKSPAPFSVRLPLSLVYRDSALFYALLDADFNWRTADGAWRQTCTVGGGWERGT